MSEQEVARGSSWLSRVREIRLIFITRTFILFVGWLLVTGTIAFSVLVWEFVLRLFGIRKKYLCP